MPKADNPEPEPPEAGAPEPGPPEAGPPEAESPGASPPSPGAPVPDPSRRRFLLGSGVAVVLAAGAGTLAGLLGASSPTANSPRNPPAELLAAAAAERALISSVDQAIAARTAPASQLALIRSNHASHLVALEAALAVATGPSAATTPAGSGSPPPARPPSGAARTRKQLIAAEKRASSAAAASAAKLAGDDAALLASIAACEACHGELLT
jgi:hypothetical protein